jgi:TM2 domain-containing membrane protein YozV
MNSVNKIVFILLVLLIDAATLIAQDPFEEQFNFAKKLYDEENYFDAVTEFKRLLFFDKAGQYSYEANRSIGLSYKYGAKFFDALRHFTLAEIQAPTLQGVYDCRFEIIKINILRRTIDQALALLDTLANDTRFSVSKDEINYWRGWAYIFEDDWEQAALSFASIDSNHALRTFCDSVDNGLYDVTLARVLSIVPGAGQFYTGEYISGLISLGWNVLWGYLMINAFIEDRIFDGVMIGTLLWWRFYSGNLENAEKFALEKNLQKTNKALRYLQNNYNGKKP